MEGEATLSKVLFLLRDGKEQEAADAITLAGNWGMWRSANILSVVYEKFSDMEILYRCIIDTYVGDGYNFPKRVMIKAKKISHCISQGERLGDLLPGDLITVYRAANTPISKVHNDISWTTEKNVAVWFANRGSYFSDGKITLLHVYQGQIQREKIIAFTNDRNEYEVIQHSSVKNIVELPITEVDIKAAMEWKMLRHNQEAEGGQRENIDE